jgi:sulfite exporter TauE/SafE
MRRTVSYLIGIVRGALGPIPTRQENDVKRVTIVIAGVLLAAALGGCVVAPAPGYYYGGYYGHGYYR